MKVKIAHLMWALCFGVPVSLALGEGWIPSVHHHEAMSQAQDCRWYRRMIERLRVEVKVVRSKVVQGVNDLKAGREKLDGCLGLRGVLRPPLVIRDEVTFAQVCPAEYENWLRPSIP